jgi:hypothetical protein
LLEQLPAPLAGAATGGGLGGTLVDWRRRCSVIGEDLVHGQAGPGVWEILMFPFFIETKNKTKSENASSLYFNKTANFILNSDSWKLIHNFDQLDDTTPTKILDFSYGLRI